MRNPVCSPLQVEGRASAEHRGRRVGRTLSSALALATMLALPARPVAAQGFTGTYTPNSDVAINGAQDQITVNTPTATIEWQAPAGTGDSDFLPSGHVVTFVNNQSMQTNGGVYTVLNRVTASDDPARRIAINGTVHANVVDANGVTQATKGNVWFYSPGGY